MMGNYEVTTVQRFTTDGIAGIWLFIGSPVAQAFCLWLIGDLFDFWSMIVLACGAVGFLSGFVLLLLGRHYIAYHSQS